MRKTNLDLLTSSLAWLAKHMMCSQSARRNLKSFQRINNLTIKPLYDYTYHSEWDAWIMYNVFKSKILREVSYHFKIGSYFWLYCIQYTADENNLKDVDDNVDRGIGNEHDVIPASQPFCPWRPLDDVTILDHLTRKTSLDLQKVKMLLQSKS